MEGVTWASLESLVAFRTALVTFDQRGGIEAMGGIKGQAAVGSCHILSRAIRPSSSVLSPF